MATNKKPKLDTDNQVAAAAEEIALAELYEHQALLEKLNDEASERVLKVEEEFNKQRKPLYANRALTIAKIPDFWYQCFLQHPFLAEMLTSEDMMILGFLRQLKVEDFNDIRSGFKITLQFEENPFFSDVELSKSFEYDSEDGQLLCSSPGIHWHPGQDPSQLKEQDTQKRPREPSDSFFLWFPLEGEPYHTGHDAVAEAIKDHLWLNPIKYYNGDVEDWEQTIPDMPGNLDGEDGDDVGAEDYDEEGEEAEGDEEEDEEQEGSEEYLDEQEVGPEDLEQYEEGDEEQDDVDDDPPD